MLPSILRSHREWCYGSYTVTLDHQWHPPLTSRTLMPSRLKKHHGLCRREIHRTPIPPTELQEGEEELRRLDECDRRSTCPSQSMQSSLTTQRTRHAEANAAARRIVFLSQMEEVSKQKEIWLMELEEMDRHTQSYWYEDATRPTGARESTVVWTAPTRRGQGQDLPRWSDRWWV